MNTYTYARLLDIAAAVESLPNLPLSRTVAPTVSPDSDHLGQNQFVPDHSDKNSKPTGKRKNPAVALETAGFVGVGTTRHR